MDKYEGRDCSSPDTVTNYEVIEIERYNNILVYNPEHRGYEVSILEED